MSGLIYFPVPLCLYVCVHPAMSYDIRWSAMFEALDRMFNNSMIPTVLDNPDPLRYPPMKTNDMVPETVTVRLEVCLPAKANNMVLFAVKALDEEGNVSPLSNVVRVEFRKLSQ